MITVLVLVEGQTEEAFVYGALRPHLDPLGVFVTATLLRTKELPEGSPYKGGAVTYRQISRDTRRLLRDTHAWVTTLIDYYGLPDDFPELRKSKALTVATDRVSTLERAFLNDINHQRFRPFLALHEFEAWIFAAPAVAESHLAIEGIAKELASAVAEASGQPELVNDGPMTHPSIRLSTMVERLHSGHRYNKRMDGPQIITKAGLEVIRAACPHFDAWLRWLESLAQPTS
jgi:hypothetical protein